MEEGGVCVVRVTTKAKGERFKHGRRERATEHILYVVMRLVLRTYESRSILTPAHVVHPRSAVAGSGRAAQWWSPSVGLL